MEKIIYEGIAKPTILHRGTAYYPKQRRDRFGIIPRGNIRAVLVDKKLDN